MAAVAFDTYRVVKRLREAGFDERQAEAVTTAIQDSVAVDLSHLVTKEHFDERMRTVDDRFESLGGRMGAVEGRLDSLEGRMKTLEDRVGGLDTKISEAKADILKAVMGMISGAVAINVLTVLGSMFALIKLLGH